MYLAADDILKAVILAEEGNRVLVDEFVIKIDLRRT